MQAISFLTPQATPPPHRRARTPQGAGCAVMVALGGPVDQSAQHTLTIEPHRKTGIRRDQNLSRPGSFLGKQVLPPGTSYVTQIYARNLKWTSESSISAFAHDMPRGHTSSVSRALAVCTAGFKRGLSVLSQLLESRRPVSQPSVSHIHSSRTFGRVLNFLDTSATKFAMRLPHTRHCLKVRPTISNLAE